MRTLLAALLLMLVVSPAGAAEEPPAQSDLKITLETLGDSDQGVVVRIKFEYAVPDDLPAGVPLVITGSMLRGTEVLKNYRIQILPDQREPLSTIQTFAEGDITVEARLMVPLEETTPVIISKASKTFPIKKTGKVYVATAADGAEAVLAEGVMADSVGAVKIRAPRRDVAPNLFIVDVAVKPPVKRVEFWVDGKKILARSSPPYRAELDLGSLPKRVEVRAVGYDDKGRYVDADAFVVNERETQLEVKITRTETPDGVSHFKLSVQNPRNARIQSVVLYAGQRKIAAWNAPPYAISIPKSQLEGVEFVRASVIDDTNYEAADLVFLSGDRFIEEIQVHLVELPVTVTDQAGNPVVDLKQSNFTVLENGKKQEISSFNFATNLPLSLGLLLDHSGSMVPRIAAAKTAAEKFFRSILKKGDRAFFAPFAFDAKNIAPFVTEASLLESQIASSPEAAGGTSLWDAIVTGLYRFRTIQGRKALVIISDGEDTTSRLPYEDMLKYARASRVPLYFIGIGLGFSDVAGTSKMKALAAETGAVAYFIKDVKQLDATYKLLEQDLRSQYLISYQTQSDKKDEAYRTIEVKVDKPNAKVRTIRGFIP